jgi:hypothetical protein
MLLNILPQHWTEVSIIYKDGIETEVATFEKEIPSWVDWDNNHLKACRIVAVLNEDVLDWATLSTVSSRCISGKYRQHKTTRKIWFQKNRISGKNWSIGWYLESQYIIGTKKQIYINH